MNGEHPSPANSRSRSSRRTTGDVDGSDRMDLDPTPLSPSAQGRTRNSNDRGRTDSQRITRSGSTITARLRDVTTSLNRNFESNSKAATYKEDRIKLVGAEQAQSWDSAARESASQEEIRAQGIVERIRETERVDPHLYGNLPGEALPDPHSRDMGGRFLANKERIDQSKIFWISRQIPKGAHLHLHFNSEIMPEVLFPHARSPEMQDTMFIRSTSPLVDDQSFSAAEIVFNVFPATSPSTDIFSSTYNPDAKNKANWPWMLWREFRRRFPLRPAPAGPTEEDLEPAERWARQKMIITEDHAYGQTVTHNSSWACFNQGTRAFKGLVGYEGVYRWYIGSTIDSMIKDRVMYAELRPMLLDKFIPSNDGLRQLDHKAQMTIICEEVDKKLRALEEEKMTEKFPFGLKIIYCTPRSIPREKMKSELADCIRLKLEFPDLICGFDLVGAEDRPNCVGFYADLLVAFQETCSEQNIEIPFMFHAGETLIDTGGSDDPKNSNLYDALLLKAKRIGHGYALLKHPLLVQKYKQQNICLELCPISNELLHLCGNAREHPYPQLLAAGLHCTLNADNPSLFRSVVFPSHSHLDDQLSIPTPFPVSMTSAETQRELTGPLLPIALLSPTSSTKSWSAIRE